MRQLRAAVARLRGSRRDRSHPLPPKRFGWALSLPAAGRLGIGTRERDNGAHIARIFRVGLPREKGEWSMKSFHKSWVLAAILIAALTSALAPRAAAQAGSISGTILDVNGAPWAEVTIRAVSDQGAKEEGKTDSGGKFSLPNMRSGIYTVFIVFPPPNDKQAPYEVKCRVTSGEDAKVDLNFKDVVAKQGAASQEQVKKAEEAKSKMEGLKAHFNAGNALIDQEKQVKNDLGKAPPDQRDALKQKLGDLADQAVKEFQEASKNLGEKDPNTHLVWFKLGEAYDTAGRNDDAAQAYQQAITAKGDVQGNYIKLDNVLAREGKIEDDNATLSNSVEYDQL